MKECEFYRMKEKYVYWRRDGQSVLKTIGICTGTKKMEECSCDGDKCKCEKAPYKIEIWQYHRIVETYESNEIPDVLEWYRDKWCWIYDAGDCAFDVYEGDRQMSFEELYKLGFYGYSFNDDIGDI